MYVPELEPRTDRTKLITVFSPIGCKNSLLGLCLRNSTFNGNQSLKVCQFNKKFFNITVSIAALQNDEISADIEKVFVQVGSVTT